MVARRPCINSGSTVINYTFSLVSDLIVGCANKNVQYLYHVSVHLTSGVLRVLGKEFTFDPTDLGYLGTFFVRSFVCLLSVFVVGFGVRNNGIESEQGPF